MKRFWSGFIMVAAFGCLLCLGASTASAYYPPLAATATFTYNSVYRTVYDPKLKKNQELTTQWGGPDVQVMDLKQHNGVISWIFRNGATFFVYYSVYDPNLAKFKEDMVGPFTSVSQLQVLDGVVAYVAGIPPSGGDPGHAEFEFATYDPALQAWQKRSEYVTGMQPQSVLTKDGVVLMQFIFVEPQPYCFNIFMYDPVLGGWWWGTGNNNGTPFLSITIDNASVTYSYVSGGVGITDTLGCFLGLGNGWHSGSTTPPQAYFVAQPTSGSSPLWVWFTDMSIAGGTPWAGTWNFGDNSPPSTSRSPYHTFTSPGTFKVSQQLNAPSFACSQYILVGYPFVLKKSLPGILYLLLLAH